jgi:hypothetical protein
MCREQLARPAELVGKALAIRIQDQVTNSTQSLERYANVKSEFRRLNAKGQSKQYMYDSGQHVHGTARLSKKKLRYVHGSSGGEAEYVCATRPLQ